MQRTPVFPCAKCIQPIRPISNGVPVFLMNSTNVGSVGGLICKYVITPLDTERMGWMHFAHGSTDVLCVQDMLPFCIARSVARPSLTSCVILCGSATLRAAFCRASLEWFLMFHL
jgi:hypothetical protein